MEGEKIEKIKLSKLMNTELNPDEQVDNDDPGDDTLKRYRYQITYNALISLRLLNKSKSVKEVFCEHFEDVLVKLINDRYLAIQIKTKNLNLGPFDANEKAIEKSIKKFIRLEVLNGEIFENYQIVTNNGFRNDTTAKSIYLYLSFIKEGRGAELFNGKEKTSKWVSKLIKETSTSKEVLLRVLAKLQIVEDAGSMDDVFSRLVRALGSEKPYSGFTLSDLEKVSEGLILDHLNAASKFQETYIRDYLSLENISREEIDIENKRMTKERLKKSINTYKDADISIIANSGLDLKKLKGHRKLTKKMDAGNITHENLILAKRNKEAAEALGLKWLHKYGTQKGMERIDQLMLIVGNESQAAYDDCYKDNSKFGNDMLKEVRVNLKNRYKAEKPLFYDSTIEHLLGFAGVLTEACEIWWSDKKDVEDL